MPLYIEVGGDSREVHGLFGVSNTTMVNTGAYDRMLLFDKKEVIAWNMVNFRSVKYGI